MQFQSKAANEAYKEIVQHVGKCVVEYESEALKEDDHDTRGRMRLEAKRMSIEGLTKAIQTAHNIECNAIGLATAFTGNNGG